MKKSILFSIIFVVIVGFTTPPVNNENRILYVFPDEVEVALNDYIKNLKKINKDFQFNLILYKEADGNYRVFVSYYEPSKRSLTYSVLVDWPECSDRRVIINDEEYPLVFDHDYDFGTPDPLNISEFGKRDETILRVMLICDGFYR